MISNNITPIPWFHSADKNTDWSAKIKRNTARERKYCILTFSFEFPAQHWNSLLESFSVSVPLARLVSQPSPFFVLFFFLISVAFFSFVLLPPLFITSLLYSIPFLFLCLFFFILLLHLLLLFLLLLSPFRFLLLLLSIFKFLPLLLCLLLRFLFPLHHLFIFFFLLLPLLTLSSFSLSSSPTSAPC